MESSVAQGPRVQTHSHKSFENTYYTIQTLHSKNTIVNLILNKYTNNVYAVKIFNTMMPEYDMRYAPTLNDMIRDKIRLLESYIHPNIISLKETIHQGDNIYMVMEYMGGGSLDQFILKHGPFDECRTKMIIRQINMAINYLHGQQFFEIKLNFHHILLNCVEGWPEIKLTNFGINKFVNKNYLNSAFLLPEDNEYYCSKGIVFNIGIIIYICLFGIDARLGMYEQISCFLHELISFNEINYIPQKISSAAIDLLVNIFKTETKIKTIEDVLTHPWMHNI